MKKALTHPAIVALLVLVLASQGCSEKRSKTQTKTEFDSTAFFRKKKLKEIADEENASLKLNGLTLFKKFSIDYQRLLAENDKFILTNFIILDASFSEKKLFKILITKGDGSESDYSPRFNLICTEDQILKLIPNLLSDDKKPILFDLPKRNKILIVNILDFNIPREGQGILLDVIEWQ